MILAEPNSIEQSIGAKLGTKRTETGPPTKPLRGIVCSLSPMLNVELNRFAVVTPVHCYFGLNRESTDL